MPLLDTSARFCRIHSRRRGFTLMEVVVALGIVAFAVPLILTTLASSSRARLQSENDTRSAWLARDVQQELIAAWSAQQSVINPAPAFPQFANPTTPLVLLYDKEGKFISQGTSDDFSRGHATGGAFYLVSLYGEPALASPLKEGTSDLCHLSLSIESPAAARKEKRSRFVYQAMLQAPVSSSP